MRAIRKGARFSFEENPVDACPLCAVDHWYYPDLCASHPKIMDYLKYEKGTPQYVDKLELWINMYNYLKLWDD